MQGICCTDPSGNIGRSKLPQQIHKIVCTLHVCTNSFNWNWCLIPINKKILAFCACWNPVDITFLPPNGQYNSQLIKINKPFPADKAGNILEYFNGHGTSKSHLICPYYGFK
jgi:hypothetical protein